MQITVICHKVRHQAHALREALLPASKPFRPYIEASSQQVGDIVEQTLTSESGQSGLTSNLARTAIVLALTLFVVGGIIWAAVVNLGENVGRDIEAAGNWGG
jgi:Flp pilus assembly protein TadB